MGPRRGRCRHRGYQRLCPGAARRRGVRRAAGGRQAGRQGRRGAVVESVKAASEIYAPVSGEVLEVNDALGDDPEMVNGSPTGDGWFFKLRIDDQSELDGLMDEAAYLEFVKGL